MKSLARMTSLSSTLLSSNGTLSGRCSIKRNSMVSCSWSFSPAHPPPLPTAATPPQYIEVKLREVQCDTLVPGMWLELKSILDWWIRHGSPHKVLDVKTWVHIQISCLVQFFKVTPLACTHLVILSNNVTMVPDHTDWGISEITPSKWARASSTAWICFLLNCCFTWGREQGNNHKKPSPRSTGSG